MFERDRAASVGGMSLPASPRPLTRSGRIAGGLGLGLIGAIHVVWATGSSWPARTRPELARAVVGSEEMPGPVPSGIVAVGALAAGVAVSGAAGESGVVRTARVLAAAGVLARGGAGGVLACRLLKLPEPGETFRRLDARVYRPLCLALGIALLIGARRR